MTHTSKEYAEALYELAAEADRVEETIAAVGLVSQAIEENPELLKLTASPAISREERMNALSEIFQEKIPLFMLTLLRMMVYRGYARDIPRMFQSFHELIMERRRESVARVASAVPMTAEETERLREKLEKRFGKTMKLVTEVDPSLLGGIRVETEGQVLDGTLRTRLQEIKEVMES